MTNILSTIIIRLVAMVLNRLRPTNFILYCVKFFAVVRATSAKFALFRIKFDSVSHGQHHHNKSIFIWIYSLALIACSNHATNNSSVGKTLVDNSSATIQNANTFSADGKTVSKDELTKIYSQSIVDYIKAVNKEYKISFDTLFFGKHVSGQPEDFPDIELPETIENTQIRLLSPEVGLQKQKERKSLFYINLMGWVDNEKAEFIFVTFSNGCEHQFDCFINYQYNAKLKEFELENSRFENYLYKKE